MGSLQRHVQTGRAHLLLPSLMSLLCREQCASPCWPVSRVTPGHSWQRGPCPYLERAATALTTTSSTSTSPPTRLSSGDTGGATRTTTGRSTSHRKTTHSKPSSSGTMGTRVTASTTGTTTMSDTRSQSTLLHLLLTLLQSLHMPDPV